MDETLLRRTLLATTFASLMAGLIAQYVDVYGMHPGPIWTVGTIPVVAALALSIPRNLLIGRFGVDAIALISSLWRWCWASGWPQ